ncbi:IS110 family transposase [Stenotrophomonas maltophilia]|jgi:transposase|nr:MULTISPECIES: IS110 family transposase [Stenotrophomonas]MBN4972822.1 IS110 family transposase [Stenotrophomonas maltophilia]UQA20824.1 IS110 family transposase [Stenotrophomonas sp. NY11291]UQA20962.1 IS110 family transposase [Stenotrophomonas sp. NY11291]UQA21578.1 IS110 family transposase [Stenotrophomonas sp. NY11291]
MSDRLAVGIDADSKSLVVARHGTKGSTRIPNSASAIGKWLSGLPTRTRIGVEATNRYHELVAQSAQKAGHAVFVLNPRDIKHYAKGVACRGKTDSGDAQVIARYIAKEADNLHEHVARSPAQERLHVLLQQRDSLVRSKTKLNLSLGSGASESALFGGVFSSLKEAIALLDQEIQRLCRSGEQHDLYRRIMTIPGIGPTVAAFITHHITRWPLASSDAWIACTGLDPRPNESGARIGRRRLSKRGSAGLRQILYMAAMGLTRSKGGKPLYNAIRERGHSSTATFNILARKLAKIAWGVFKSGRDFDPAMLKVGQACFQQA